MSNRRISVVSTIGFLIMLGISLTMTSVAQDPGAVQNPPTIEPSILATAQAKEAAWQTEFESRSIFDLSIAYLIAPHAEVANDFLSEESFVNAFGAEIFHTWDEFNPINEQQPFQVVLIHDSFYEQIDTTWSQQAYRNYVLLVGIGMPFTHIVDITGDKCIEEINPHYREFFEVTITYFKYAVQLSDETYRDEVAEHLLQACNENYDIGEARIVALQGVMNFPVEHPEFLSMLVNNVVGEIMIYEDMGMNQEER